MGDAKRAKGAFILGHPVYKAYTFLLYPQVKSAIDALILGHPVYKAYTFLLYPQ